MTEAAGDSSEQNIDAAINSDESPESTRRNLTRGLLALVDQAFVSLNNFITFVIVAQLCDRSDLNLYVLAWSIFNIFRVIQERGLAAPYFVFSHEKHRDLPSLLGSSLVHQALFAVVVGGLFLLMSMLFGFRQQPVGIVGCMLVLVVASPFVLLRDHLRAISCAHFRYGYAVMLSATAMFLQIALILAAYGLGWLDIRIVFAAMGIGSLVACLVWLLNRPEQFRIERSRIAADWRDTFSFSKWLVTARLFPSLAMGLMPWLVMWLIDEDAAGTLGGCITLANISNMFVFGANYFFLPRAVKALNDSGQKAMCRVLLETVVVFSVVLSMLCAVYFILGDWLLVFAFDESFQGYAALSALIGLSYLIVSYSTIAGNGMTALGSPEGLFWGELSFGIVAIVAGALLTYLYGLNGTAFALCFASLCATVVEAKFFFRLLD